MAGQQGSDEVSEGMDEAGSGAAPKQGQTTDRSHRADPSTEKQDQLTEGVSEAGTGKAPGSSEPSTGSV